MKIRINNSNKGSNGNKAINPDCNAKQMQCE